jgi:hypothetical protein
MKSLFLVPLTHPNRVLLGLPLVLLLITPVPADEPCGQGDSWIFRRSQYSHDSESGSRVAQYAMKPAIEPLPDVRQVTSGYSRSRSVLRGADGSSDTTYRVQSYGNGRGGMDAQWERFHDAWRGATVGGGRFAGGGFGGFGPYGGYGGYGAQGGYPGRPGYGVDPGYGVSPADRYRYNGQPYQDFRRGYQGPDPRRLDPDAADGYPTRDRLRPDREFYWQPRDQRSHHPHPPTDGHPPGEGEGSGRRR